ncbi:hypothetical protein CPB83DRAFT_862731 [Crepidotus variabilis]|uniref:Uncharacterized protein n=1 Tax=Crepidotus variabilis TaxID=179855 RepID=A0A9P6E734_9AGAR|nr:hypothetical protein CPB83DRAFT_862731 [Crepidotus variabilis]
MNLTKFSDDSKATVPQYLAVALPLTAVSIWVIMALHTETTKFDTEEERIDSTFLSRLVWPLRALRYLAKGLRQKVRTKRKIHVGIV